MVAARYRRIVLVVLVAVLVPATYYVAVHSPAWRLKRSASPSTQAHTGADPRMAASPPTAGKAERVKPFQATVQPATPAPVQRKQQPSQSTTSQNVEGDAEGDAESDSAEEGVVKAPLPEECKPPTSVDESSINNHPKAPQARPFPAGSSWNPCLNNGCFIPSGVREDLLSTRCMAAALAEDMAQRRVDGPQVTITHVINPFPNKGEDPQYFWTLDALQEARDYALDFGINVETLAVTFQNERVKLPPGVKPLPILCDWRTGHCVARKRWGGLYRNEEPVFAAMLPDVWQLAYLYGRGRIFVFTNYDIIVRRDFYVTLAENFRRDASLRVIDNLRRDMVVPLSTNISSWRVQDIFNWRRTTRHPGHDCFALPRSLLPCLQYGDFMMGMGYWGQALVTQMRQLVEQFGLPILVDTLHITRHLGHRTGNSEHFIGAGKDWKESHEQQMEHNHWQYVKAYFRLKANREQHEKLVREGKELDFTTFDVNEYLDTINPSADVVPLPPLQNHPSAGFTSMKLPPHCQTVTAQVPLQPTKTLPAALWVAPGVDAIAVRRTIEYSTGHPVGSAYTRPSLVHDLPGEDHCDRSVIAVHVDGALHTHDELFARPFPGQCNKCSKMLRASTGFDRAVFVIGDAYDMVIRHFQSTISQDVRGFVFDFSNDDFPEKTFKQKLDDVLAAIATALDQAARFVEHQGNQGRWAVVFWPEMASTKRWPAVARDTLGILNSKIDTTRVECAPLLASKPLTLEVYQRWLLAAPDKNGRPPDPSTVMAQAPADTAALDTDAFWRTHQALACKVEDALSPLYAKLHLPFTSRCHY